MEMPTITYGEIIDAVRKNGYEKGTGTTGYTDKQTRVFYACALGQAALNLGHEHDWLWDTIINGSSPFSPERQFMETVYKLNDDTYANLTMEQIADELTRLYAGKLDEILNLEDYE